MNCQYCTNEDIQARIIYKDDLVMVFPTNIPITPGHTLVCPTRHIALIEQLSDDELKSTRKMIVRVKDSLTKSFGAEGFNIAWNEGVPAGQSIAHLHIHIVPRKTGDTGIYEYEPRQFLYRPGSRNTMPEQELQEISRIIRENIV